MTSMSELRSFHSRKLRRGDPLWREAIGSAALLGFTGLLLVVVAQFARI
jgi:hypothetical protein